MSRVHWERYCIRPCSKSHTKVVQSPDEDSTNTLPPEALDEHATPGGYYLQYLSATQRGDDTEREGARGLRVPAKRIETKGRFRQVTEGEDEARMIVTINSPDGVLPHRFRTDDTAMLSEEKDLRKDMSDITHTSGDAHQKIRLFSGGKQTDQSKTFITQNAQLYTLKPINNSPRHGRYS